MCTLYAVTSHCVQTEFRTFYFAFKQASNKKKDIHFKAASTPFRWIPVHRCSGKFQYFVSIKQHFPFKRWVNPKPKPTHVTDMVQLNDTMAQCEPSSIKYTLSRFNFEKKTCCCIKLTNNSDSLCFFSVFTHYFYRACKIGQRSVYQLMNQTREFLPHNGSITLLK